MENTKNDHIWQLLKSFDFRKEVPYQFHCKFCKNVAADPIGSLCGCRYCFDCVLKNEKKQCPGETNLCKRELLELNVNVTKNLSTFREVVDCEVKCPYEMCEERCSLGNMNDHLRVCVKSTVKCPYESIGCKGGEMSLENLESHYNEQWIKHSDIMIEAFNNLKKEFNNLKKEFDDVKETLNHKNEVIQELREDSQSKERIMTNMNQELKERKDDIHDLNTSYGKIESLLRSPKTNETLPNDIKKQTEDVCKEIIELKGKDVRRDREMEVMKNQTKAIKEKLGNLKKNLLKNMKTDFEEQKQHVLDLRVTHANIEEQMNNIIMKMQKPQIFDEKEFIWRINNFSKMKDERDRRDIILWRYSLKLCLSIWCTTDQVSFGCRIMKGEFNELLKWPMKHKITMSLINQDTINQHKTGEYHYDAFEGDKSVFDKPQEEISNYLGNVFYTDIKYITYTPGILLNDSLIVSLTIDYN